MARTKSPAARRAGGEVSGGASASPATLAVAGWAYGVAFAGVTAARISHETHLQSLYRDGLRVPAQDVGTLWSIYYFWCALCDPLVGIGIDFLKARGVEYTTVLLGVTPLWAYVMRSIWAPSATDSTSLLSALLPYGVLQSVMIMVLSAVLGALFPAGPARQVHAAPALTRHALTPPRHVCE